MGFGTAKRTGSSRQIKQYPHILYVSYKLSSLKSFQSTRREFLSYCQFPIFLLNSQCSSFKTGVFHGKWSLNTSRIQCSGTSSCLHHSNPLNLGPTAEVRGRIKRKMSTSVLDPGLSKTVLFEKTIYELTILVVSTLKRMKQRGIEELGEKCLVILQQCRRSRCHCYPPCLAGSNITSN